MYVIIAHHSYVCTWTTNVDEKECCQICDQLAPAKYRMLLFSEADWHGALVARFNCLVANLPFSITDDECQPWFACRTCVKAGAEGYTQAEGR